MATGESKLRICPKTLPDPEKNALSMQYALRDRTDKYNSKIQTCFSVICGPSHAL